MKLFLKTTVIAAVIALITACGGSTFELFPDTETANTAPVANAGTAQTVLVGATVTLNGSASSDANGDTLTYSWSITSRPGSSTAALSSATVVNPTFVADLVGDYVLSLAVSDGKTTSSASTVTITAAAATANVAPVANAGAAQSVAVNTLVTLDGSASRDANGDALTYSWSFTRPTGSTALLSSTTAVRPTFTADVAGSYVLSLTVNDGKTNSAASSVTITCSDAPTANAGTAQSVLISDTVTLDGSASSDPNGDALTYSWSLTSKPSVSNTSLSGATSVNPTFTPDVVGPYILSLIVNDGKVSSPAATVTITAFNTAPVANAGADKTVIEGTIIQLDGSGSSGAIQSYNWSRQSASCGSLLSATSSATIVNPTLTGSTVGICIMALQVSNTKGGTTDTVSITVTPSNTGSITVTW